MIKLIAFDMDESFMPRKGFYEREHWARDFDLLRAKGIRVLPISGDQYQQVADLFPMKDEMTIGGLNGSVIFEKGQLIKADEIDRSMVQKIMQIIAENGLAQRTMLCGINYCYFLEQADPAFRERMNFYFSHNQNVSSFLPLPDDKFTEIVIVPGTGRMDETEEKLKAVCAEKLQIFNSGVASIDILQPEVSKGNSLKWLASRYDLSPEEIMAFGDGLNDIEMLKFAGHSYAMKNAREEVKEAAKFVTKLPAAENGVLDTIEKEVLGM